MQRILRSTAIKTEFNAEQEPLLTVEPGETFLIETNDNYFNLLHDVTMQPNLEGKVGARQYPRVNPVAGPVWINGASPGDILNVHIKEITIREWGWTGILPKYGPLADLRAWPTCQGPFSTIIRHDRQEETPDQVKATYTGDRTYTWDTRPFIGTIATAPERGSENTLISQGPWGGNLDVADMGVGAIISLNVAHPGGLLFLGDVHASQGDGEITGIANETAADITLECQVQKDKPILGVARVESKGRIIQIESARHSGSIAQAIKNAYIHMIEWLVGEFGASAKDAYLLLSAHPMVRFRIYQATTRLFTCGISIPKSLFGKAPQASSGE